MLKALGMSGDYRRSSLWTDFPSRKGSTAADSSHNLRRVLSERKSSRWAERFSALGRKMLQSKRSVQEMDLLDLPDWREKTTIEGFPYYHNVRTGAVSWEKPDELKTKAELEEDEGEWVWIPHPTNVWQPAKMLKSPAGGAISCKTVEGDIVKIPHIRVMKGKITGNVMQKVPLWPLKKSTLRHLEDDLVMLEALDEGLLMHVLRERYQRDEIYTWVGSNRSVLVSINPFKKLPIYSKEVIHAQRERSIFKPPPPHVFGIANDSLEALLYENRNQSILISGESGAGKTECTKQCLDFLAVVAGANSKNNDSGFFNMTANYGDDETVEQKVLVANPVLEAFGNAKTIRNNNSSRFGKWIEIQIDRRKQTICGAKITSYLLERTRITMQQPGERNYHVFYQLCANEEAREKYGLGKPEEYHYLNQSGTYSVDGLDDAEELQTVMDAMEQLGFGMDEQEWMMRIAAGVLHLGNVTFKATGKVVNHVKASEIVDRAPLDQAAKLLGVVADDLAKVLSTRSINVRGENSEIPLKLKEAVGARDSIAKATYGRLFTWLVERVNDAFGGNNGKMIGILDIFGFEIFEHNSFEQLCINFTNEKLQQHFNDNTFRDEEELYVIEGIKFKHVEFKDNQPVLDLIEMVPGGILPMLDDEGMVPGGTDLRFYKRMVSSFQDHPKFKLPKDKKRGDDTVLTFEIDHYAHRVKYNAAEFLIKNSDTLYQDMYNVFARSEEFNTQLMFPELGDEKRLQVKSIGNQFRAQLNQLMTALQKTQSRFIRCIKPNAEQAPNHLNCRNGIEQLRSSGVFEAVEIRKTGFPFRYTHQEFAVRYRCINVGYEYKSKHEDWKALCEEILYVSPQKFAGVQFGSMRVMYRVKDHKVLNLLRNLAIEKLLPRLQAVGRGYIARSVRRGVESAEEQLRDAIEMNNDIRELDNAIENAEDEMQRIEDQHGVRPMPRNLVQAKGLRADLEKWVQLEDEMENLEFEEAEEVVDQLKAVIAKCDKLMSIPQTYRQETLYEKMKEMLGTQIELKPSVEGDDDMDDDANNDTDGNQTDASEAEETASEDEGGALTKKSKKKKGKKGAKKSKKHDGDDDEGSDDKDNKADATEDGDADTAAEDAPEEAASEKKSKKSKKAKKHKKKHKRTEAMTEAELKEREGRLKRIEKDAKRALAMLDRPKMEIVYQEAKAERHKFREIKEIRKHLAMPEIDFVRLELGKAIEWKDAKRRAHREIRLKELKLEKAKHEFLDISKYSQIRDAQQFASAKLKNRLFGTERLAETMLVWTDKTIPTSLLNLPPYGNKLGNKAIHCFKSILSYMGDRRSSEPDVDFHAKVVVTLGLQNPLLRNEIFLQIVKQLTQNPTRQSTEKGWMLLRYCMTAFPPGDEDFENFLMVWLERNVPQGEDWRHFKSAMHAVQYGRVKLDPEREPNLDKIQRAFESVKNGSRYSIRSPDSDKSQVQGTDEDPASGAQPALFAGGDRPGDVNNSKIKSGVTAAKRLWTIAVCKARELPQEKVRISKRDSGEVVKPDDNAVVV